MCRNYGYCLNQAIWLEWKSFTCSHCESFEPEEGDSSYWAEQFGRSSNLLTYLFHKGKYERKGAYSTGDDGTLPPCY